MPVFYKVTKNNNDSIAASFGKYYGHIVYVGTKTVDDLADEIQAKCTVHKADVKAVVAILIEQIKEALVESYRVELDGLGTFKYGMSSKPADAEEDFSTDNIKKLRVLFQPTPTFDAASKTYTRTLTAGVKFKKWALTDEDTKKKTDGGSTSGSGSQSSADSGTATDPTITSINGGSDAVTVSAASQAMTIVGTNLPSTEPTTTGTGVTVSNFSLNAAKTQATFDIACSDGGSGTVSYAGKTVANVSYSSGNGGGSSDSGGANL